MEQEKPLSAQQIYEGLSRYPNIYDQFLYLWQCAWKGHAERCVELLTSFELNSDLFRLLLAALLLKQKRISMAMDAAENLQNSRYIAARVLCSLLAYSSNERSTAVDMLYRLMDQVSMGGFFNLDDSELSEQGVRQWKHRIQSLIVSCYASANEYTQAIRLCIKSLESCDPEFEVGITMQLLRLIVQVGDVERATNLIRRLESMIDESDSRMVLTLQVCTGIVAYAESDYQQAYAIFEQILNAIQQDASLNTVENMYEYIFDINIPLLITVYNNLALCCLNLCELNRAIVLLEHGIKLNPLVHLHPSLVFNLCTLYDLAKPRSESRRAKEELRNRIQILGISDRFDEKVDLRL